MLVVREDYVMGSCNECGAKSGHIGGCPKDKQGGKSGASHPRNINKPSNKERGMGYEIVDCITCKGSGRRGLRPCQLCGGRGRIRVNRK